MPTMLWDVTESKYRDLKTGALILPPIPTGAWAGIGDSTWYQDGLGESRIKTLLTAKGYAPEDGGFYGAIGKAIFTADVNGKTVPQNISDIRAALGREPDVWLFNLGSNGSGRTETQVRADIDIAFDALGDLWSRVVWVGLSQAGGVSNEATRLQWNSYAAPRVTGRGGEFFDWYTYTKTVGDAGWWQADGVHMTTLGYEQKNIALTDLIGTAGA